MLRRGAVIYLLKIYAKKQARISLYELAKNSKVLCILDSTYTQNLFRSAYFVRIAGI
jgi:hypothetical protein